jgi:hypothetical protein
LNGEIPHGSEYEHPRLCMKLVTTPVPRSIVTSKGSRTGRRARRCSCLSRAVDRKRAARSSACLERHCRIIIDEVLKLRLHVDHDGQFRCVYDLRRARSYRTAASAANASSVFASTGAESARAQTWARSSSGSERMLRIPSAGAASSCRLVLISACGTTSLSGRYMNRLTQTGPDLACRFTLPGKFAPIERKDPCLFVIHFDVPVLRCSRLRVL